jgi:multimeric flavodoxin WrbA
MTAFFGGSMGKVLVQYYSRTGRTQQMTELVAKGAASVNGIEVRLMSVAESN